MFVVMILTGLECCPFHHLCGCQPLYIPYLTIVNNHEQAGVELGQAQLKLGLNFTFARFGSILLVSLI